VRGELLAISHFFPPDDVPNRQVIENAGIATMVYKTSAIESFESAGWRVELQNRCVGRALPTPESALFEGARADGLPVAPTELEWSLLRATGAPG
jgi:hypothetical protein